MLKMLVYLSIGTQAILKIAMLFSMALIKVLEMAPVVLSLITWVRLQTAILRMQVPRLRIRTTMPLLQKTTLEMEELSLTVTTIVQIQVPRRILIMVRIL